MTMIIMCDMAGFVPHHRQVATSRGIDVDAGIRDLLEALWAAGMETEFSCEGGPSAPAHVCFSRISDAYRFAGAIDDAAITEGARHAWVDFPSARIAAATEHWTRSRERRDLDVLVR